MQYAILGSGRLARHISFYLNTLGLPLVQWSRNNDPLFNTTMEREPGGRLDKTLVNATHILLAVSDQAISEVAEVAQRPGAVIVHFSGALSLPTARSAHPLMTFGERLETLAWYRQIPFLLEQGSRFADLLPGLPNTFYEIPAGAKCFYHALCSLAGNSTFMLWRNIGDRFENELGLPRELLQPFLHQVVASSSSSGERNFTGPVARGDWPVVRNHLQSLSDRPELLRAYESYLHMAASSGIKLPKDLP